MLARIKKDKFLIVGIGFIVLLLLFAVFGPHLRYSPEEITGKPFLGPGTAHWMGTDQLGRDTFARLAAGARTSLIIGVSVQSLSLLLGIVMGVIGIFSPKWIAQPVLRFTDTMFAFPDILLAILIIIVVGMGKLTVVVALTITAWPGIARLVKNQLATLKDREFVVATRAAGANTPYLVWNHILPQLWGLLLAVTMVELAGTILSESTLSFLGIGVQPPEPSWGNMINEARTAMVSHLIMLLWPCGILSLTIFALNFVGDGLRNLFDPKQS